MNAKIYYVGGSKGGVGKSKVSFALIDYLTSLGEKVAVFETDTSNPDVYKAHQSKENLEIICKQINLDTADGWIELVNYSAEFSNHSIVINSAARSVEGIEKYGGTLKETLEELKRELITLWVINRQRDSVELLRSFMNSFGNSNIHVLRNLYFGESTKFELYNNSNAKKLIEENNGQSADFPDLADRVADKIYSNRWSISMGLEKLPLGDKAELRRWRKKCEEMFIKLFSNKRISDEQK